MDNPITIFDKAAWMTNAALWIGGNSQQDDDTQERAALEVMERRAEVFGLDLSTDAALDARLNPWGLALFSLALFGLGGSLCGLSGLGMAVGVYVSAVSLLGGLVWALCGAGTEPLCRDEMPGEELG